MPSKKDHRIMERMDKIFEMVLQSSTKGIRAVEIGDKLNIHKTMVYRDLNSLHLMGKVYSDQGLWKVKTEEQTIMPKEREIVIELPLPEKHWFEIAQLELLANRSKDARYSKTEKMLRTLIEKYNETRIIKIRGKNVDDLDLEKMAVLIKEANEKSSKVNLKGFLKKIKP